MQLILDTYDVTLRSRQGSFLVSAGEEKRLISPHRISSIAALSRCTLSSAAVLLAVEHGIPIIFIDECGDPEARIWSTRLSSRADIRRAQVVFALSEELLPWAVSLFRLKAKGQMENLQWGSGVSGKAAVDALKTITQLSEQLGEVKTGDDLSAAIAWMMGKEGAMANAYWKTWGSMAPSGFEFSGRSRRPSEDMYNAVLNYVYGMLYNTVESAAISAGLDPMLGVIHADQFGEATLGFDLIEPFRPLADRMVMKLFYDSVLDNRHFEFRDKGGVWVNRSGRFLIIPAFNDWLETKHEFGAEGMNTINNHLFTFAGRFAAGLKIFWDNADFGKLRHRQRQASAESGE